MSRRDYAIWVTAGFAALVGMWAKRIGVGWLAYELTQSVFWVGIVAAADLLPTLFVGPWAGSLGDRYNRLRIIQLTQLTSLVASAALFAALATDTMTIAVLTGLVVVDGFAMAFKQPSRMALVRALVPKDTLGAAIALNAIAFNIARFVGPAVAGFLILATDISAVFVLSVAGSAILLGSTFSLRLSSDQGSRRPPDGQPVGSTFLSAGRWALCQQQIAAVLVLSISTAMLLRGFVELLPGFAAQVMARGPGGLAAATSAMGIGAIAGGLWLGQRGHYEHLLTIILSAAMAASLVLTIIVFRSDFYFTIACMCLIGVCLAVAGVGAQTLIQSQTPEDRLSRVLSIYGIVLRAGPALGALMMGALTDFSGFTLPFTISSLACFAIAAFLLWRSTLSASTCQPTK